jgi:hypothetical protein
MEKLRKTIQQFGHWKDLEIYVDRMAAHLESDFSHSLENAKALLESIGKEICSAKSVVLTGAPSINAVLKKAFCALGYSNENMVNQVSRSLANIGEEIGDLRNEISPTSHGKSLDELRDRNSRVDALTREFLIDSTLVVAIFLIRAFEERKDVVVLVEDEATVTAVLKYEDLIDFNTLWDDAFGDFVMDDYSYTASEVLFRVDYKAYEAEYKAFKELELEVDNGEE